MNGTHVLVFNMLTNLLIRNFKKFDEVNIELGSPVVFIGPNNSGKTSALQAVALWELGLRRWQEKRNTSKAPSKRPGVVINRRDFIAAPIPNASLLWRDLHVRDVQRNGGEEKLKTSNVRIDIQLSGFTNNVSWDCGFEFDYANEESFYCRPLRLDNGTNSNRMLVPPEAAPVKVAFLPPMSGLAEQEFAKQPAEISYLIGQGRTAEVLRNLCYLVRAFPDKEGEAKWNGLTKQMKSLFGVELQEPELRPERAEILLSYKDQKGSVLDISCSGRGVQQTLLLLAYLSANPNTVLLLDEPDAHLEILKQREIYRIISEQAESQNSQIIAASHSEIVLNEAADKDLVIAFVGKPHRIDDRGSQVLKSLKEIGFDQYYQAEQKGWVLYLEGATDLAILRAFAEHLNHPAASALKDVFVHYVQNQPQKARAHFQGLREAKLDLVGFLLCDRLDKALQPTVALNEVMLQRREIENYLCQPATLLNYAINLAGERSSGPLFDEQERTRLTQIMDSTITNLVSPIALQNTMYRWWHDTKASDEFLDPLFEEFFRSLSIENIMRKSNYHKLAKFVEQIDPEIGSVLDKIVETSNRAEPSQG